MARPTRAQRLLTLVAAAVLCAVASSASSSASAEEYEDYADMVHRHEGLFVRATLGVGGVGLESHQFPEPLSASGGSGTASVAVGGTPFENLVVYLEGFSVWAVKPKLEIDGMAQPSTDKNRVAVNAIGPGAAYYFMPWNVYVSGTLAFSRVIFSNDKESLGDPDWGFGTSLAAGKEWWASADWGLGVAAQVYLGSESAKAFSLSFSATYH